jgi:hypothetical protein
MTRAALLPAGGDPYLLAYWLRHYAQIWADEVDELRILVNGQDDPTVRAYIAQRVAEVPHASVEFLNGRNDHGDNLRRMADATTADHIVFCEDDAFVRHPGVIADRFGRIERGEVDVIGTARGNAGPKLLRRAEERFGPPPITLSGESGLSLYPCFLFIARANLPSGAIGAYGWRRGEYIPALDYTCDEDEAADTFTYTSWALRAAGLRVAAESAYRSDSAHRPSPERRNVDGGTNNGDAPWFHVGSLSSGYGCSFMVDQANDGYRALVEIVRPKGELYDWHKRMSWWTRVADVTEGELPEFHERYRASLDRFMADVDADPNEVWRWRREYDPLVTWQ